MRTILVTGAATWVGGRLVQRLEARSDTTVVPVDELAPRVPFATPLLKASLDTLEFARTVIDIRPDVVIHLQTLDRTAELGRLRAREGMVLGAQALFGAISRVRTVRQVLVKSDTAIYGAGPRHPSILNESTDVAERTTTRYERSLEEVERFVADVAAKMPDVDFTMLRFVGIFGEAVGNGISHYLRLPTVPTILGWDPRLQLIHEDEAVRAVLHTLDHPVPGTFNIAADGQLYLSRILRLGKRRVRPSTPPAIRESAAASSGPASWPSSAISSRFSSMEEWWTPPRCARSWASPRCSTADRRCSPATAGSTRPWRSE